MRFSISPRMISLAALLFSAAAFAQVSAVAPYTVSTFATSVPGVYTQPDSIAVLDGHVFIGFGNGAAPDGSDGKSSTIVEYDRNGNVITTYSVKGHNDGLKVNPLTHHLWSMQNEDGNPNLVIIDPKAHTQKVYTFGPTPHGGGYDDIAFRGHDVFVSASNPLHNPNSATPTSVGRVNLDTGVITNVVTGMVSPHGMAFIRDDRARGD